MVIVIDLDDNDERAKAALADTIFTAERAARRNIYRAYLEKVEDGELVGIPNGAVGPEG
jgi:hypothetical protein